MKKWMSVLACVLFLLTLMSCSDKNYYGEIAYYVKTNMATYTTDKEIEFFDYEATGLSIGGVYYGYYYSKNNVYALPEIYTSDDMGTERYTANGGYYFGSPNNGTDWCFVKRIMKNWYYYELHWA